MAFAEILIVLVVILAAVWLLSKPLRARKVVADGSEYPQFAKQTHGRVAVQGVVSGFQQRNEQLGGDPRLGTVTVWSFRVERVDADRKPLPRVAVEMRGRSFSGAIINGDVVSVEGFAKPGQPLKVDHIKNLSSSIVVKASGNKSALFFRVLAAVVFLSILFFAVLSFFGLR